MRYSIYTLSNPITNAVFYVGKTVNIKTRFKSHLNIKDADNSMKNQIIEFILHNSAMPIIEEIDYVDCVYREDEDRVNELEVYWIWQFKEWGFDLCNVDILKRKVKYSRRYSHVLKRSAFEATIVFLQKTWDRLNKLKNDVFSQCDVDEHDSKMILDDLRNDWNKCRSRVDSVLHIGFKEVTDDSWLLNRPYSQYKFN